MDGLGEADAVIVSVVDRVEELHEDVAEDVELFEALLVDSEWLDNVATTATLLIRLVNLSSDPVV